MILTLSKQSTYRVFICAILLMVLLITSSCSQSMRENLSNSKQELLFPQLNVNPPDFFTPLAVCLTVTQEFLCDLRYHMEHPVITNITETYTGNEFTPEELDKIDQYIQNEVDNGFPGAVLLILKDGQIVKETAYGSAQIYNGLEELQKRIPMVEDTLFDLASLTKSFATALSIMNLEYEGSLNSNDPLAEVLPEFDTPSYDEVSLASLLTHTSGFDASYPFYRPNHPVYGDEFYTLDGDKALEYIAQFPPAYTPMTDSLYSDLGYIALGKVIEKVSGVDLDEYTLKHLYDPLGLSNTFYLPLEKGFDRNLIAATERMGNTRDGKYTFDGIRTYPLIGEVHDELAYYTMQGVSGHAGLFSTAYDLAVLSQLFLNRGTYNGQQLFTPDILKKYLTPSLVDPNYTMGFDTAKAPLTFWRYGLMPSEAAFGKTGWTGTMVLMDPTYNLSIVLLTNKRHTAILNNQFLGSGFETGNYSAIVTLIYEALLNQRSYDIEAVKTPEGDLPEKLPLELGIDQFYDYLSLFDEKRVGLITNGSGINSDGIYAIDLFHLNTDLKALFSPEHGIRGNYEAGVWVEDTIDAPTNVPVYSLYNEIKAPTEEMLQNIDIMAYDIQDVGTRYYTYIYTLISSMEACGAQGIPLVVFDRPNPTGGLITGNLITTEFESSIGKYGLPIQYGLTVGELATYLNETLSLGCELTVVPMKGYDPSHYYTDYDCTFTAPSPNMKTIQTAYAYPATVFIEGTNISEGRGTEHPFEVIGAPFINPYTLCEHLNDYQLEGVEFRPTSFIPDNSKYAQRICFGVRLVITNPQSFDALHVGLTLLHQLVTDYPDEVELLPVLNLIAGTDLIAQLEQTSLSEILDSFATPPSYEASIEAYRLYPE